MAMGMSCCCPQPLFLLLPLLLLFSHLSLCASVDLDPIAARQQSNDRVLKLPGQSFNVSFNHYSGYVTVNEENGRALFWWFFEATQDPDSKPLVVWLNGGPGCSSIAYGVAEEVGPFHINADGKSIYLNPHSWNQGVGIYDLLEDTSKEATIELLNHLQNQAANLLFVDSPVGVGYSYSNNSKDLVTNGDKRTANDSRVFLEKWLERYPQFKGRELYLTGESYAGHYVPQLAQAIVHSQKSGGSSSINLKGYMVGNALTDDYHDHYGVFQFMWATGVISDQTFRRLNLFCDFESFVHTSSECDNILDVASQEMGNIDPYSIFTPSCPANVTMSRNKLYKRLNVAKIGESYDPCTEKHSTVYFNLAEVKKALHVNPIAASSKWETCSNLVNENWLDSERSVLHIYRELIKHGLRIWIFSGDTDAVIPVTSTRYNVDALSLPTVTPFHPWYESDGQVGGWTQEYKGLTFVTVRGAGHEVPLHRPKQALTLLKSFLAGSPMPTLTELHSDS